MIMFKRFLFLFVLTGLLIGGALFATSPQSTNYVIPNSLTDSGGQTLTHESYRMLFQSVGPVVAEVSSASAKQLVSGIHFSSEVTDIAGFDSPNDADEVTLNATTRGTITTKVLYEAEIDGSVLISIVPSDQGTNPSTNFQVVWDSTLNIPTSKDVSILARAFDGLTYGPQFETPGTIIVDNIFPNINFLTLSIDPFSPNNFTSPGIKDTTTINFQVSKKEYSYTLQIKDGVTPIRTFVATPNATDVSVLWDGKNDSGLYVADGSFNVALTVDDFVAHQDTDASTVLVDNVSPVHIHRQLH